MGTVKVLFCTSQLPGAVVIRGVTWSQWSHCALIDGDEVVEAAWPKVRASKLADVIAAHTSWAIVEFPCEDPAAAIAAARSQIGKPYDLMGAVGLAFHRDWQNEGQWWCSDLLTWAIMKGGTIIFRVEEIKRTTPGWLFLPNFPILACS